MRTVSKTTSYCCGGKRCSQMTASYNLRASFARSDVRGRRFCLAGIGGSIRQLAKSTSFSSHCCRSVGYSGPLEAEPLQALFNHYKVVQDPALYNRRYSDALKDFVEESILAYECGYSHTIVEARVHAAREAQGQDPQGVGVDWHHLQRSLSLVWLTLMISPRSVPRFHSAPVVDESTARQLKGFVTLIVTAYYEKRWAWYPLGQLQLELAATGPTEKPHNVAEMARLVYATLEAVAPQFPK